MFSYITKAYKSYTTRLTTNQINKMIRKIIIENPIQMGERKIFYVTQYASKPPRFAFFVNNTRLFTQSYINFSKIKLSNTWNL